MARDPQLSRQMQDTTKYLDDKESDHLTEYQPRYCIVLMEHLNRRYESWQKAKMCFFTCALLVGSFTFAALLGYWFFSLDNPTGHIYMDKLYVHVTFNTSRFFELRSGRKHSDLLFLRGNLGLSIPKVAHFKALAKNSTHVHVRWTPYADLKLLYSHDTAASATCYEFIWIGQGGVLGNRLEDCIDLGHNKWYGTFMNDNDEIKSPKESKWFWTQQEESWIDFDSLSIAPNDITLERYWLASNGVALHVSSDVPLKARLTTENHVQSLCLKAALKNYSLYDPYTPLHLRYSICQSNNVKSVHQYMVKKYELCPGKRFRETRSLKDVLWIPADRRTNGKPLSAIATQQLALRILDEGHKDSAIVVDIDGLVGNVLWQQGAQESVKGSLSLSIPAQVSSMMQEISAMGFCLVTRIPFVKLLRYSVSSEVSYQSNKCTLECVNFNDKTAVNVFTSNMLTILSNFKRQYNVCTFLFDMREAPSEQTAASPHLQSIAHDLFNSLQVCCQNSISNVAFGVQKASLFIKMRNIKPNWGRTKGLKSIIPEALKLSILGYPYIIPPGFTETDHVSVNSTSEVPGSLLPDVELYIRWFQLISLFPVTAVTVEPWMYQDTNLSHAVREALNTRKQLLPTILQLTKQSDLGQPVLRPLWWLEPNNMKLHTVEDQFLLGDNILVAPVVEPSRRSRDIYFPAGRWKDQKLSLIIKGGQWHRNYEVSFGRLPYFLRTKGP